MEFVCEFKVGLAIIKYINLGLYSKCKQEPRLKQMRSGKKEKRYNKIPK